MNCSRCGKPFKSSEARIGDGDGSGQCFAHVWCFKQRRPKVTAQEWARSYDRGVEYANYQAGRVWEEEAWARSLGFAHAEEYHRESDEAFSESVREDKNWEAWG